MSEINSGFCIVAFVGQGGILCLQKIFRKLVALGLEYDLTEGEKPKDEINLLQILFNLLSKILESLVLARYG